MKTHRRPYLIRLQSQRVTETESGKFAVPRMKPGLVGTVGAWSYQAS
jgi:hypothetical protein